MTTDIQVRRANFKDAQAIADFVNSAHHTEVVSRLDVSQRFSQVGFMLAEQAEALVGVVGWQVENLVVRITDFILAPEIDIFATGEPLIKDVENAGKELQAEAAMLFMPPEPSENLLNYWNHFGYTYQKVADLPRAWREAANEWNAESEDVVVKKLRERLVRRPM